MTLTPLLACIACRMPCIAINFMTLDMFGLIVFVRHFSELEAFLQSPLKCALWLDMSLRGIPEFVVCITLFLLLASFSDDNKNVARSSSASPWLNTKLPPQLPLVPAKHRLLSLPPSAPRAFVKMDEEDDTELHEDQKPSHIGEECAVIGARAAAEDVKDTGEASQQQKLSDCQPKTVIKKKCHKAPGDDQDDHQVEFHNDDLTGHHEMRLNKFECNEGETTAMIVDSGEIGVVTTVKHQRLHEQGNLGNYKRGGRAPTKRSDKRSSRDSNNYFYCGYSLAIWPGTRRCWQKY